MFLINFLKRKLLFLLGEIKLYFFLIENKESNILKDKNLGNKQTVIQEETFSLLREIAFYKLLLFLSKLNKERIIVSLILCLNLSQILDKSISLKNKHISKTNFAY